VATDVDLMSTYVGASRPCIAALIGDPQLEAMEVSADQTVHCETDTINPPPSGVNPYGT
jgi:hypothetical protein